jgi:ABC-type lipopolysaccharide export system ATPase subunit
MLVPSFVCTFSCGLLGPSGAGKSTFFSTIGGTQTLPKQGLVYRYHVVNAIAATSSNTIVLERILPKQVAWLQQHASFFEMLTVYETLSLAAQLELPHMSAQQRDGLIDQKMMPWDCNQSLLDALAPTCRRYRVVQPAVAATIACRAGSDDDSQWRWSC